MIFVWYVNFAGIKIIFWDLREPFINNLYKNNVSQLRLDTVVEALDMVGFFFNSLEPYKGY